MFITMALRPKNPNEHEQAAGVSEEANRQGMAEIGLRVEQGAIIHACIRCPGDMLSERGSGTGMKH